MICLVYPVYNSCILITLQGGGPASIFKNIRSRDLPYRRFINRPICSLIVKVRQIKLRIYGLPEISSLFMSGCVFAEEAGVWVRCCSSAPAVGLALHFGFQVFPGFFGESGIACSSRPFTEIILHLRGWGMNNLTPWVEPLFSLQFVIKSFAGIAIGPSVPLFLNPSLHYTFFKFLTQRWNNWVNVSAIIVYSLIPAHKVFWYLESFLLSLSHAAIIKLARPALLLIVIFKAK